MKEDNGVKKSFIDPETHAKFAESFVAGTPEYDLLA